MSFRDENWFLMLLLKQLWKKCYKAFTDKEYFLIRKGILKWRTTPSGIRNFEMKNNRKWYKEFCDEEQPQVV